MSTQEERPIPKDYMGDAVYAEDAGFHLVLYTSDGMTRQAAIYLEDSVFRAIIRYSKRMGWATS